LCSKAGFGTIRLRGDTDFSLTTEFDRWDRDGVSPKPSAPAAGVGAGVRVGLWLLGFRGGRVGGRAGLR
jgi:hypothetical protein